MRQNNDDCFRLLFENLSSAAFVIDPQNAKILNVNQSACTFYGYSHTEFLKLGIHDLALLPKEEIWRLIQKISRSEIQELRMSHRLANGEIREVEAHLGRYEFQGRTVNLAIINDITERVQNEAALKEAHVRYHNLFEQSHDAVFILDLEGKHLAVNHHAAEIMGYMGEEMVGISVYETSAEIEESLEILNRVKNGEHIPLYERRFKKKNGEIIDVEINVELVRDVNGNPLHVQSVVRDISERKRIEKKINASEELKRAVIDSLGAHIAVIDAEGNIIEVNEPWLKFAVENGITDLERTVVNVNYLDVMRRAIIAGGDKEVSRHLQGVLDVMNGFLDTYEADYPCNTPTMERWFTMKVVPLSRFQKGAVIAHENITWRKLAEQEMEHLATTDTLTGLANRRHFFHHAEAFFDLLRQPSSELTAIMVDIDHFKKINDQHGHSVGDEVLREVAKRLRINLRPNDLIGRYGGEEFSILLPRTNCQTAQRIAERLRFSIASQPIHTTSGDISTTASFGISCLHNTAQSLDELLNHADQALYAAKHGGRNCCIAHNAKRNAS